MTDRMFSTGKLSKQILVNRDVSIKWVAVQLIPILQTGSCQQITYAAGIRLEVMIRQGLTARRKIHVGDIEYRNFSHKY